MAKGGKYLRQAAPQGSGQSPRRDYREPVEKKKKKLGVVPIILIVIVVLLVTVIGGALWYINNMLGLVSKPGQVTTPSMSAEEEANMLGTLPTQPMTAPMEETETTSPEDTWPEIHSDQNITNIMVVGQAAREDEDYRLADSMILCSINRETKTLTMTSFMRDLRVVIPAYAGHSQGFNRINNVYHLGSHWTGEVSGSMEMLALAIEQNFGVHVDHTVEVGFYSFMDIVDLVGGIDVELNQQECEQMWIDGTGANVDIQPGANHLNGYQALMYARMRKVGHGDFDRTARQRHVITEILKKCKEMSILEVNNLFREVMPMIVTDMTTQEMTNYAFELIPMLKGLNIVSQSIPFEGTYWSTNQGTEDVPDWVLDANLKKNGEMLRESIGMVEATE